jgi:dTDP-4-amino-4,6-dideoxygalactose transaminase
MCVLNKPATFFIKVFSVQLKRLDHFHDVRRARAADIVAKLDGQSWRRQLDEVGDGMRVVQSKLYIHSASILTQRALPVLATAGIDAKHLEQRSDSRMQLRLDIDPRFNGNFSAARLPNYLRIHDRLLSLPLNEDLSGREIDHITKVLNSIDSIKQETIWEKT